MDGTEQTLFENTDLGEFSGYVFLDKIGSGDTVVLRMYIKDVESGVYKLRDLASYSGVQSVPCVGVASCCGKVGLKVTAEQTAGTYKEITHMWFKK